jgi:protein-disulfide isomerase-like protein with CxxC motif
MRRIPHLVAGVAANLRTLAVVLATLAAGAFMAGQALGQECTQTAEEVRAIALQNDREIVAVAYPKFGTDAFDEALVIDQGVARIPGYPPTPITVIVHIRDGCVLGATRLPRPPAEVRAFLHARQQEA